MNFDLSRESVYDKLSPVLKVGQFGRSTMADQDCEVIQLTVNPDCTHSRNGGLRLLNNSVGLCSFLTTGWCCSQWSRVQLLVNSQLVSLLSIGIF